MQFFSFCFVWSQLEVSDSSSSSNLSLAKARPNSDHNNGQSPSHLKVQKNISSNQKQRRYSDQGEHAFWILNSAVRSLSF